MMISSHAGPRHAAAALPCGVAPPQITSLVPPWIVHHLVGTDAVHLIVVLHALLQARTGTSRSARGWSTHACHWKGARAFQHDTGPPA